MGKHEKDALKVLNYDIFMKSIHKVNRLPLVQVSGCCLRETLGCVPFGITVFRF